MASSWAHVVYQENSFTERVIRPRKCLYRALMEPQYLEVFKKPVVVVLWGNGLVVGLAVLWEQLESMILEVFSSINDFVIPREQALAA